MARRGIVLSAGSSILLALTLLVYSMIQIRHNESVKVAHAGPRQVVIVALGDSLTAGYGLLPDQAWPTLLEQRLRSEGVDARVINAGVSGDTVANGLARLDWVLEERPDIVVVELGANDALRGLDPARTAEHLEAIITRSLATGARVLLAGMHAPANLGQDFRRAFDAIYPNLAHKFGIPLYPFFLDGVATRPELNQPDGIHPNAVGTTLVLERLYPHIKALVDEVMR